MTKIVVTLGPSTSRESDLKKMKELGVDFVRANMSHTSLPDLKYLIGLSKKVGIPFILDTDGPQVRTGKLLERAIPFREDDIIKLYEDGRIGTHEGFSIRPKGIIKHLREGDHIHFDGSLLLRVIDVKKRHKGYAVAVVARSGRVGENKGIAIDSVYGNHYDVPTLSEKDHKSIKMGLSEKVSIIAVSFVRHAGDVQAVRDATKGKMQIISKIECQSALENLDAILDLTDGIIIDRHDLCKEISREHLFYTQKNIFDRAKVKEKFAFASSYMLESMVDNEKPTESEKYNITSTIHHGASGLILSAETTIGAHPIKAIETLKRTIKEAHKSHRRPFKISELR